jgi:hypothetical protein
VLAVSTVSHSVENEICCLVDSKMRSKMVMRAITITPPIPDDRHSSRLEAMAMAIAKHEARSTGCGLLSVRDWPPKRTQHRQFWPFKKKTRRCVFTPLWRRLAQMDSVWHDVPPGPTNVQPRPLLSLVPATPYRYRPHLPGGGRGAALGLGCWG